jgi:hypothetical protein
MNLKWRNLGERTLSVIVPFVTICFLVISIGIFSSCVNAQDSETSDQKYENFDPKNFDNPTNINNEWMTLKPGMRYVYAGTTVEEDIPIPHRVVIHVTDLTKMIGEIRCVVAYDLDFSEGELVEAELAFFAQDNEGNVWRMGEYPEEYEEGEYVLNSCWLNGIDGAIAGISMKGEPILGSPSYSQGWSPSTGFTDRGQVYLMGQEVCVPMNCYEDVMVIAEGSEEEGDAKQLKYWAKGVGNVKVGWMGEEEKTQEVLELVDVIELGVEGLTKIREEAIELEKSAYERSKDVYGLTSPLEFEK